MSIYTRSSALPIVQNSLKVWLGAAKNTIFRLLYTHPPFLALHSCEERFSLEVWYDGERVWVRPGGVLGPAGAAALDEDVVLAGEGDGAERDDEEQVRHVRLHALAVQEIALLRAANEKKVCVIKFSWTKQEQ